MTEINHVTESSFQTEVLDSTLPVLVDFTAVWCGPCKMLEPLIKQLADEWQDKVKVVKLDVDTNPNLAMRFQVMGVPTVMLFQKGQMVERVTGYQPKDRLIKTFGAYLE